MIPLLELLERVTSAFLMVRFGDEMAPPNVRAPLKVSVLLALNASLDAVELEILLHSEPIVRQAEASAFVIVQSTQFVTESVSRSQLPSYVT